MALKKAGYELHLPQWISFGAAIEIRNIRLVGVDIQ